MLQYLVFFSYSYSSIFILQQSSKVFGAASLSNSRGISRDSSSASTPEQPRSPSDLGNSIGNSNSNASASLGNCFRPYLI